MPRKKKEKETVDYIKEILDILEQNYRSKRRNVIPIDEVYEMMKDLYDLFNKYFTENQLYCSELSVKRYIPLINLLLKLDRKEEHKIEYEKQIKNAFRIGARTSFSHYMVYREWEERDRFYGPRFEIMQGYVHFLGEIATNPNFNLLIANAPSGYGKSFPEKLSEAWNFGYDPTGTVLSLCSNDDVVKGGSRTVIDELKSEWFGEVFPDMKWDEKDKNYFLKETESNWKLRDCKLPASYYAKTTQSNVVGSRASQRIHIDDLYADYKEAMNQSLNEYYFNKFITVWNKRFVQNKIPKVVVTGTLWASGDFIARVIEKAKKEHTFYKSEKYKYTWVSEDGTAAIIQIPALDYETGRSTCPELRTTKEILKEKDNMEPYLFETNFQQRPTDPEALAFSYNRIRTYERIPKTSDYASYAVIDATRRTGKDFFSMPILKKIENGDNYDYYLKDCIYTQEATKDMYEKICNKIIEHHIIKLVIESNVTSELKKNIEDILSANGITYCEIIEKYNTEVKETRIVNEMGNVKRKIVFPKKGLYGRNTEMGTFMESFTSYNLQGRNEHDDANDSLAMFSHEIIDNGAVPTKIQIIRRPF